MDYTAISPAERAAMLARVGLDRVDDLFVDVPPEALLAEPLPIEGNWSEIDLSAAMDALAQQNTSARDYVCFAGGGIYDHYRPAFIDHVLRRSEFFTAYTPYQPEVSQGTLQAIWEYQTGISELTGLPVANASMYDGATALVEAAFMALRVRRRRRRVLASATLGEEKLATLRTYGAAGQMELEIIAADRHLTDADALVDALAATEGGESDIAAVLLPYPNYCGIIEDVKPLIDAAHAVGALAVLDTTPILLGLLKRPGNLGADVAVGEGQPLGNAMSFGGPGLGYFACSEQCLRQMPGRLVGRTVDVDGQVGYVLTLATREQHIRREKATSNICSNHALNALTAGLYLAGVGTEGLRGIAADCCAKARYLRDGLLATDLFTEYPGLEQLPFGYEFALKYAGPATVGQLRARLFDQGWLAGIELPDDVDGAGLLLAVTERRTVAEIDDFISAVVAQSEVISHV
ncbi:MAG: aminomethyl-transferring glycine dehydrogenase subunit GcvPA [Actinomycetes bacterium]|jgi:glycine dehydrogenase subunit 1|nr:aminomethyl-transferring glycine dehydrogenase subunit GcvPA [Actinomycetes bacterium]